MVLPRCCFWVGAAAALAAPAADWPQFLGPTRSAAAAVSEPELPEVLSADIQPLWKVSVGAGFAGPVVVGGSVIIFHREGGEMVIQALGAADGKTLWRTTYTSEYVDSFGFDNGPRAVPAVAQGRVFTHGPEGRVTCVDLDSGKEVWAFDTVAQADSPQGFFGRAASPLVLGRRVIIAAGGTKDGKPAGLIALRTEDGALDWQGIDDEAAYASPVLAFEGDRVLSWMRNRLWLADAASGRALGSVPLRARMDASVNAATPIACGDGRWFVSAGYGVGANLFEVTASGQFQKRWTKQDVLDCHYGTPVFHAGHLFGFHGRQETGQTLRCVDIATGGARWESGGIPGGTLLRVGGKLVIVTEQGELWLVRATPEKFEQLSVVQILRSGHRSHAAYAAGVLYARDAENLVALRLR